MSVLNESILDAIVSNCDDNFNSVVLDNFNYEKVCNAIEKLFLEAYIDLLREFIGNMVDENDIYQVNLKIKFLLEQLTELNKIQ